MRFSEVIADALLPQALEVPPWLVRRRRLLRRAWRRHLVRLDLP
jgi:hypothetical protein